VLTGGSNGLIEEEIAYVAGEFIEEFLVKVGRGVLNERNIEGYRTLVSCRIAKMGQEVVVVWRMTRFVAFARTVVIIKLQKG
jgi:hypothetical protein